MAPYFETGESREVLFFARSESHNRGNREKKDSRCIDGRNLCKEKNSHRKKGRHKRQLPAR
jgi:hypothetical protein